MNSAETPTGAWLDPVEDRAWRAWLELSEHVRAAVARDLQADSGLSEADYAVLAHLSEHPDHRIRLSDLAAALHWSKSRLSHQVARMEARGQLAKEGCPQDARGWYATLTDSGLLDIRRAAPFHVASVRRNLLEALDRAQMAELSAISAAVTHHLSARSGGEECPAA